ncbi:MAG: hypothetical protein EOP24_29450 [Hyphomicrobiales bacterium]|nr:MAG: hypothetical protein EOP24_29450 [Hyphomicrobiales bacterium]
MAMTYREPIDGIAENLSSAAAQGIAQLYETIITYLAPTVEIYHSPPVPELDGRRTGGAAAAYLREELIAFPRAFEGDLTVALSSPVVRGQIIVFDEVHWKGTLRSKDQPVVDIGFRLELVAKAASITAIGGSRLSSTSRVDFIAWLTATADAGGFDPPRASVDTR